MKAKSLATSAMTQSLALDTEPMVEMREHDALILSQETSSDNRIPELAPPDPGLAESVSIMLSSFRLSEQNKIVSLLKSSKNSGTVLKSFQIYLDGWKGSKDIDSYKISTLGQWFADKGDAVFRQHLKTLVGKSSAKAFKTFSMAIRHTEHI